MRPGLAAELQRKGCAALIDADGVTLVTAGGSVVRLHIAIVKDVPRADFAPEGNQNINAPQRWLYKCIDALAIGANLSTGRGREFVVETCKPLEWGDEVAYYTGVLLETGEPPVGVA
jgi:hypothetical protein